jgi:hypothetical protein
MKKVLMLSCFTCLVLFGCKKENTPAKPAYLGTYIGVDSTITFVNGVQISQNNYNQTFVLIENSEVGKNSCFLNLRSEDSIKANIVNNSIALFSGASYSNFSYNATLSNNNYITSYEEYTPNSGYLVKVYAKYSKQ